MELAAGVMPREIESWDEVPDSWRVHQPLLPTPTANSGLTTGETAAQRVASTATRGLMLDEAVVHLLPTPSAGNFNDGESLESWTARRDRLLKQGVNGNGMGTPPGIAVQLLPTPSARDWKSDAASEETHAHNARPLNEVVRRNLLPTPVVTDARGARNETSGRRAGSQHNTGTTLGDVAYADRWGAYGPAVARWATITDRPAPDPTEPGKRGQPRLAPRFVEWMLGLPAGWVTSVPGVSRTAALTALGNGQVPQCAAAALRALLLGVRKGATA